jgi:hypothetical protein
MFAILVFAVGCGALAAIAASDEEQRKKDARFNRQLEELTRETKWESPKW